MLTKGKILLLTTLCLLSLVSFGFASWTISSEIPDEEVLGSMHTDNVINSAEFIELDYRMGRADELGNKTGINWFDYEQSGYLDENRNFTDTGHINTYYRIDRKKCSSFFKDYDSLMVTLTLKYKNNNNTDLNIFAPHISYNESNLGNRSLSYSINTNGFSCEFNGKQNGRSFVIDIVFIEFIKDFAVDADEQYYYFDVDYAFFATTGTYFNQYIYQYLYGNSVEFTVSVYLSGINYDGGDQ